MHTTQFAGQQNTLGQQGYQTTAGGQFTQDFRQNQNTIKNPQSNLTPTTEGPQVNDRDFLNDALSQEKYLTDGLNVFAREASHRQLHNDVVRILNETHAMTRELFNLMFRKGWYTLETEEPQKISQTLQQFAQYRTQFPYQAFLQ